jgi:hypothetical protein
MCTAKGAGHPSLCCNGSNCTGSTSGIGTVCSKGDAATAACTPGITLPAANGSNDTCGYSQSGFNENILLCDMTASGGGSTPAVIEVFYSDEHALTLGCDTMTNPVSMMSANPPDAVFYPQTGDPACVDTSGRPLRPVLFVTDITADPNCTTGDQQNGGTAYDPVAVFGTWKSATENGTTGTPNAADPPINYWDLGTSADQVTAAANTNCPCTSTSCNTFGLMGRGYGAEIRFEVGLVAYHSYRLQIMLHDGDQTQGGDSSEGCAVYCAPAGR